MGAPHNIKRYGEVWPEFRIQSGHEILEKLKDKIIISGGWAWHFMSEPGHTEYKHTHDHKDIDVFVRKENSQKLSSSYSKKVSKRSGQGTIIFRAKRISEDMRKQLSWKTENSTGSQSIFSKEMILKLLKPMDLPS